MVAWTMVERRDSVEQVDSDLGVLGLKGAQTHSGSASVLVQQTAESVVSMLKGTETRMRLVTS
jgi:hypothetical protein